MYIVKDHTNDSILIELPTSPQKGDVINFYSGRVHCSVIVSHRVLDEGASTITISHTKPELK